MTTASTRGVLVHALALAGLLLVAGITQATSPAKAAIASAHPLATAAGFEVLEAGGNAFDAAVAVAAALAVVEPYGSGLGGGGFFLLHDVRRGVDVFVDAREMAPLASIPEMYQNARGEVVPDWALNGPLAAAIPGVPAALVHLAAKYGQLPLDTSLRPAIRLARDGFPVDERYRQMARMRLDLLRRFADTSQVFLFKGDVPVLGTLIRQPDLAATLEELVRGGHDGFYRGVFAGRLVDAVTEAGGIWTLEDLAKYQVIEREPLVAEFRGSRIVSAPPPSAGGIALIASLHILDALDYSRTSGAARDHLVVEALRRVFRDRALYLGDPAFTEVPTARLVSVAHARSNAAGVNPARATSSLELGKPAVPPSQGDNTTHFSILDRQGNRVGATLSINMPFGSAFLAPGTGILLNNEMDDFATAPGQLNGYGLVGADANAIAPGKRPLSSMAPTFVEYNDRVAILGTPGGSRIPGAILQQLLGLLEARDPVEVLAQPRFHHQYLPDVVEAEPEYFGGPQARDLRSRGHVVKSTGRNYGNAQLVVWEKSSGKVTAVSDGRGVGQAIAR
ncbi:MAG: gamma-glutamyltransferase [Gammaproteobacteria bacterium]